MTQPRLAPIDQMKMRETVYGALKAAFTRGDFAPGDVLSLRDLAEQLGCSMTPVREAVRRLVAEGALIDTPSRTLMVPAYDKRRMAELKSARLALERLLMDQVMERITAPDIAALETILDASQPDSGPNLEINYDFHFTLYRVSGSQILLPLIEGLWMQYGAYLNLIIKEQSAAQLDEHCHHREIIAALKAGDRDAAQAALIADIDRSFRVLSPEQETPNQ